MFLKLDDANRPNQPTSQKPMKMDNFYTTCPVDRQVKIHSTHTFSMVLTSVYLYKTGSFVSKIITVALFEKN